MRQAPSLWSNGENVARNGQEGRQPLQGKIMTLAVTLETHDFKVSVPLSYKAPCVFSGSVYTCASLSLV